MTSPPTDGIVGVPCLPAWRCCTENPGSSALGLLDEGPGSPFG